MRTSRWRYIAYDADAQPITGGIVRCAMAGTAYALARLELVHTHGLSWWNALKLEQMLEPQTVVVSRQLAEIVTAIHWVVPCYWYCLPEEVLLRDVVKEKAPAPDRIEVMPDQYRVLMGVFPTPTEAIDSVILEQVRQAA